MWSEKCVSIRHVNCHHVSYLMPTSLVQDISTLLCNQWRKNHTRPFVSDAVLTSSTYNDAVSPLSKQSSFCCISVSSCDSSWRLLSSIYTEHYTVTLTQLPTYNATHHYCLWYSHTHCFSRRLASIGWLKLQSAMPMSVTKLHRQERKAALKCQDVTANWRCNICMDRMHI